MSDVVKVNGFRNESPARAAVSIFSVTFFLLSLLFPALKFDGAESVYGWTTLIFGWIGIFLLQPAWIANPIYLYALILIKRREYYRAQKFCLVSCLLGLCSIFCREWYFNEAYGTPIKSLGIAFYLWLSSFVVLLAGITFWINPLVSDVNVPAKTQG